MHKLRKPSPPFKIELDRPDKIYYPGELVEGYLTYLLGHRQCEVKGFLAVLFCRGEVHWGCGLNGDEDGLVITPTYLAKSEYVFGNGKSKVCVKPGCQRFRFSIKLPNARNCPQTIKGPHGSITFSIGGIISGISILHNNITDYYSSFIMDPTTKWSDFFQEILVKGSLDLNNSFPEMELNSPGVIIKANSGFVSSLLKNEQLIIVSLSSPKKGYVGGEIIQFHANINNKSLNRITTVNLKFIEVKKFVANFHSKISKTVLCEITGPTIEAISSKSWGGEILVPEGLLITSEGINSKRCVSIQYHLKIFVESTGSQVLNSVKLKLPIIIGTIALNDFQDNQQLTSKTKSIGSFRGSLISLFSIGSRHLFPFPYYSEEEINDALNVSGRPPDYFTTIQSSQTYPAPPTYKEVMAAAVDEAADEDEHDDNKY